MSLNDIFDFLEDLRESKIRKRMKTKLLLSFKALTQANKHPTLNFPTLCLRENDEEPQTLKFNFLIAHSPSPWHYTWTKTQNYRKLDKKFTTEIFDNIISVQPKKHMKSNRFYNRKNSKKYNENDMEIWTNNFQPHLNLFQLNFNIF